MIVSNEPGYYKEGDYGIRIENLQVVTDAEPIPGGERPMHGFETLTLAPIDRRLIDRDLLTPTSAPGSTPTTPACWPGDRAAAGRRNPRLAGSDVTAPI